jgi:hypothetical protein
MTKLKAVIQTNSFTGEHRVFYKTKINGRTRVVKTCGRNVGVFQTTGYISLKWIEENLKGSVPVYTDEQILLDGQPVEALFGKDMVVPKHSVKSARKAVAKKLGIPWKKVEALVKEVA